MNQKIIGIMLVCNEERFVEQAVCNVLDFCDQLLLVDHQSSDQTVSILQHLQDAYPEKISLHHIQHPSESQTLLKPWIGTSTWVFGVDGDELYDPERLNDFRTRVLSGEFNNYWMVVGNVLHVDEMDEQKASGYFAPPSRSITKLYNFAAIEAWPGKTLERLHGGQPEFRPGFHGQKKRSLQHEHTWEEAPLRCLHLCFLERSSFQPSKNRANIMELYNNSFFSWVKNVIKIFSQKPTSWKQQHYARGTRSHVEVRPFFKNRK